MTPTPVNLLALGDAMAKLDPTFDIAEINALFDQGANQTAASLESILDGLRRMVSGGSITPTPVDDVSDGDPTRLAYHENLAELQKSAAYQTLIGKLQIATQLPTAAEARTDLSAFLSLYYLTPFVLKATDADARALDTLYTANEAVASLWNDDRNLTAEQKANGEANFTDQYLADRAKMLGWAKQLNAEDKDYGLIADHDNEWTFRDAGSDYQITLGPGIPLYQLLADRHRIAFGSDDTLDPDTLIGGDGRDHLYGMAGDDTLIGGEGGDYLEGGTGDDSLQGDDGSDTLVGGIGDDTLDGGSGNDTLQGGVGADTYIIEAEAGTDTLIDSDGQGRIRFEGHLLDQMTGHTRGRDLWQSEDGSITYLKETRVDGSATLRISGQSSSVLYIKNYTRGMLGIQLEDSPETTPPNASTTIQGDLTPQDFDPATPGIQMQSDTFGNVIVTDTPSPDREDTLYDSASNDLIRALGGNDRIHASRGGDDDIDAGSGRDIVEAGAGNDRIQGGDGGDIIDGGAGDDTLYGQEAQTIADALAAGSSHEGNGLKGDWIAGGSGQDTLIGTDANDVLTGGGGQDLLIGGVGDDDIMGDTEWVAASLEWTITDDPQTHDRLFSPTSGTSFPSDAGADVIYAGAGNDHVWADGGNDIVFGEDGNDQLSGNGGNDSLYGGNGNDLLVGDGVAVADFPETDPGDDWLDGGAGDDILTGRDGADVLLGGEGSDALYGQNGDDRLDGGIGDDMLLGGEGNDDLQGGEGNDELSGGSGDDTLDGGNGNDQLWGMDGNDVLSGGDGDDTLVGGAGNDTLIGGAGADIFQGDEGADTIYLNLREGDSVGGPLDGNDHIVTDISEAEIGSMTAGVDQDGNLTGGVNSLLTDGVEVEMASALVGSGDLSYFMADGSVIKHSDLLGNHLDQALSFNSNEAALFGGKLDDDLTATGSAASTLYGGQGNDRLRGNTGNNTLIGGAGDDTYLISADGGVDRIQDDSRENNTLQFSAGVAVQSLRLKPNTLVLDLGNGNEVDIAGFDKTDALNSTAIKSFKFDNGVTLSLAQLLAMGFDFQGTSRADTISGTSVNDRMYGYAGNDWLIGDAGDDTLDGGAGSDVLIGGEGNNVLIGGLGDDTYWISSATDVIVESANEGVDRVSSTVSFVLNDNVENLELTEASEIDGTGNALNNNVVGNDAANRLSGLDGNDDLQGQDGNDVLIGGAGNDTLLGGQGNDTYELNLGDGADAIMDNQGVNSVAFGASITVASLQFSQYQAMDGHYYLKIAYGDQGDHVVIRDGLLGSIQSYRFADGTVLAQSDLMQLAGIPFDIPGTSTADIIYGTTHDELIRAEDGNDEVHAGDGNDSIDGGAGQDSLDGGSGNDTLDGGLGNDTLSGGDGIDRYMLNRGMGKDTVLDTEDNLSDILHLGGGIALDDLRWERQGDDLFLHLNQSDDGVLLKSYYVTDSEWRIQDGQGTTTDLGDFISSMPQAQPVSIDSLLSAYLADAKADFYSHKAKQGYIVSADGTMHGPSSWGPDRYVARYETVSQYSDEEVISRLSVWEKQTATVIGSYKVNETFFTKPALSQSSPMLDAGWTNIPPGYSGIKVDGVVLNQASFQWSTSGAQWLIPADSTVGSAYGAYTTSTYTRNIFERNTVDTLEMITGGDSDNFIYGNESYRATHAAQTVVDAGSGNDEIRISDYSREFSGMGIGAFLNGNTGNDSITGSSGDDVIVGGEGDDHMNGGAGADRYVIFADQSGNDEISDTGSLFPDEAGFTRYDYWYYKKQGYTEQEIWSLPPAPHISPTDYAALEPLYTAGLIRKDTVEFGEGIDPNDVAITYQEADDLNGASITITWGVDKSVKVIMPFDNPESSLEVPIVFTDDAAQVVMPSDNPESSADLGWGIEQFKFADGTVVSMADMMARAHSNTAPVFDPYFEDGAPVYGEDGSTIATSAGKGLSVVIGALFFDPDTEEHLTYQLIGTEDDPVPDWLSIDSQTGMLMGNPGIDDVGSYTVSIRAIDSKWKYADGTLTLQVNENTAPEVGVAVGDQAATQGQPFSLTIDSTTFRDVDSDDQLTLTGRLANGDPLPSWLTFDAVTNTFSGIPGNSDVGTLAIMLTATDLAGATANSSFTLNIANINDAPTVADPLANQTATPGSPFSFTVPAPTFADIDVGDTLTYSAALADGSSMPAWLAFDDATATFSGQPGNDDVGVLQIAVTATDIAGSSVFATLTLEVAGIADHPAGDVTVDDGHGNITTTHYDANGIKISQDWLRTDGSTGSNIFNVDGSFIGSGETVDGTPSTVTGNADGSYLYAVTWNDGSSLTEWHAVNGDMSRTLKGNDGSTETTNTDADGRVTLHSWHRNDGSHGDETYLTDGSHGSNFYGNDGSIHNDWVNADGSYGSFTHGNDGTDTRTWHNVDGSYSVDIQRADGGATQEWHAVNGDYSRTTTGADSSMQTDYYAADGSKTGDVWLHPDGSYGSDAFNADGSSRSESHYPNGSTIIVIHAVDGSVQNIWLNADGSSSSQTVFADSSRFNTWHNADGSEGTQTFDANWNMTADSWRSANGFQGVNAGGNHLLLGTSGNKSLWPASGSQMLIGGAGDDIIATSWSGNNVVSFNEGDGHDILYAGGGDSNTLSLGGRFAYDDLRLLKNGNDLVLQMGADDTMTFKEWYGWSGNRNIDTLQVIAEAMADFDTSGSDVLRDDKVETFDFAGVVEGFDQARAVDATLDSWAMTDALLDFHLSGSDVDAIGGDLAYQYGMNGTLSGVGLNAAQSVIAASQFGQTVQSLNSPATWQTELVRLG